jgi:hypothetical protein
LRARHRLGCGLEPGARFHQSVELHRPGAAVRFHLELEQVGRALALHPPHEPGEEGEEHDDRKPLGHDREPQARGLFLEEHLDALLFQVREVSD